MSAVYFIVSLGSTRTTLSNGFIAQRLRRLATTSCLHSRARTHETPEDYLRTHLVTQTHFGSCTVLIKNVFQQVIYTGNSFCLSASLESKHRSSSPHDPSRHTHAPAASTPSSTTAASTSTRSAPSLALPAAVPFADAAATSDDCSSPPLPLLHGPPCLSCAMASYRWMVAGIDGWWPGLRSTSSTSRKRSRRE